MTKIPEPESMDNFDELLEQGFELLDRGAYSEALPIFERCLAHAPQSVRCLFGMGVACCCLEQYEAALESFCLGLAIQPQHILSLVFRGLTYRVLNKEEKAKTDFQASCEITPQDAEGWRGRGIALHELEQYEAAIEAYDQAITIKSNYYIAWFHRGVSLTELDRYEEAIFAYDKAIVLQPNLSAVWFHRGVSLNELERYEEALLSFDQVILLQPDCDVAWFHRGVSLNELERYEEAIESYDKMIALKSNHSEVWVRRGLSFYHLERYEKAIESYDKAISIEPYNHGAWCNRGRSLCSLEQYEEAIKSCETAIEISPNCDKAWCNRADSQYSLKQYEEAIESYDKAISIAPDNYEGWNRRGLSLAYLERYEEAIESYDQAITIKHDYPDAWSNRGISLHHVRRYEEAIESYDQAIIMKSTDYVVWNNRGLSLHQLNQHEKAIESYNQALVLKQDYPDTWFSRGISLHYLDRYEEAVESYDQAISLKQDYFDAWFGCGSSLQCLGRYEKAIESYDQAISLKQNNPEVWFNRGNSLDKLEQYEKAIESYDQAIVYSQGQLWRAWKERGLAILRLHQDLELALTAWDEGIQAIPPNASAYPYGIAMLHRRKAETLYESGKGQPSPFQSWFRARDSYKTAIDLLPLDDYPKPHLALWQDFLKVCQQLGNKEAVQAALQERSDKLKRLLDDSERSLGEKISLERRFESFKQIRVDHLAQQDSISALELAETCKNRCLWRLREGWEYRTPETSYEEIQSLLNETTAAIYWHQSPAAITTFVLRYNQPPKVFSQTLPKTSELSPGQQPYPAAAYQLSQFENWLQQWKTLYQNYNYENRENDPWRQQMELLLFNQLRNILEINRLHREELQGITNLILIPHRDLHLLPLQALFPSKFRCTTLPSARLGIELASHPTAFATRSTKLMSIEDPRTIYSKRQGKTPQKMLYAELESSLISTFMHTISLADQQATRAAIQTYLAQPADFLHFTGHAYHNFDEPLDSALALAGNELLTLRDIFQLNLNPYRLVCLSACETGLTRQRDLTDEYVGLVAGFLKAGANYVVSTLWIVDEISSALFMIRFYENLSQSLSPIDAFREAQTWLKSDYATLIPWYESLHDRIQPHHSGHAETLKDAAILARQKAERKGMDHRPFDHPYHWAGFTITGYENPSF